MKRPALLVIAALAAGAWSGPAGAGAWTTYMHTYSFSQLTTVGDTVWCTTREAGLLRFAGSSGRFDTFFREPGGLISNQLTALTFDRSGRLWVGTTDAGVSRLSADRKTWDLLSVFDGLPSDTVTVLEAKGDTVYIGTTAGIALWDGTTIAGAIPDGVNPSPFANNFITGVVQLGDSVWVSTPNGIYVNRLSDAVPSWTSVNGGLFSPRSLGLATDGTSLFTYGDNLTYKLRLDTGQWAVASDKNVIGSAAYLGHDNGVVTLATSTGIYRWDPALNGGAGDWAPVQTGGPYGSGTDITNVRAVYALAFDPGTGTTYAANESGLRVLAPGCTQCTAYPVPGPSGNDINNLALQQLSRGPQIYINTVAEGVSRFDGESWRLWPPGPCSAGGCDTTFQNSVSSFALGVTPNGRKWVACWGTPTEEFDDAVSPPSFIHHQEAWVEPIAPQRHSFGWATAVDPAGGMWISLETDGRDYPSPVAFGIDYYGPDGTFMRNYQPANTNPGAAMRGGQIRGLTVDHRGRFWVGYTGLGVQYFDWPIPAPPAAPDFFTVSGTEDFYIQSLRTYGDSLWVLTDKDLRRYDARSTNPATNSIFSPPGETVQHAVRPLEVGPDGSVWLGTSSGLRIYHPGGRIEDFKVSNSPIASDGVRAIVVDPRSGVAWIGTTAGLNRYDPHYVPPSAAAIQSLHISVRPNPMPLTAIGTPVLLSGGGDVYDGEIYDLNGRVVNRFTQVRDGQAFWNGRDQHGTLVKPGIYFVRATSKGHSATARVAVVR